MTLPDGALGHAPGLGLVRVVGTGLLGTSLGLALRARGVDVQLYDPSPTAMALARDLGAGRVTGEDPSRGEAPDLIVVAAPPDVVADVVERELGRVATAVVTDVASVKAGPLSVLRARGADLSRYVGGHPMAGRERTGAVAARSDLFAGRPWVLTPTPECSPHAVAIVRALAESVGAVVSLMGAADHDVAVAAVSHLPQIAASLVAARLQDVPDQSVALAGQGVRDVTRIAAGDPTLWTQILAGNAAAIAALLRQSRTDIDVLVEALDAVAASTGREDDTASGHHAIGARAVLATFIARGNAGHARIPGKHGAPAASYVHVPVVVPDRPGELARLLHDVGQAQVNLEDLRLEHSDGQPVGLAEIAVLPTVAATLVAALRDRGWTVHG